MWPSGKYAYGQSATGSFGRALCNFVMGSGEAPLSPKAFSILTSNGTGKFTNSVYFTNV